MASLFLFRKRAVKTFSMLYCGPRPEYDGSTKSASSKLGCSQSDSQHPLYFLAQEKGIWDWLLVGTKACDSASREKNLESMRLQATIIPHLPARLTKQVLGDLLAVSVYCVQDRMWKKQDDDIKCLWQHHSCACLMCQGHTTSDSVSSSKGDKDATNHCEDHPLSFLFPSDSFLWEE